MARVVEDLKDESEPYRRMVMETTEKVIRDLGTAEIDARLEELLIDGILYAFQEQVSRAAAGMLLACVPCLRAARHRRHRWAGACAAVMHHPHMAQGCIYLPPERPCIEELQSLGWGR